MYDERDPYLWDVIVESTTLLDQLDVRGLGKPAYWDRADLF